MDEYTPNAFANRDDTTPVITGSKPSTPTRRHKPTGSGIKQSIQDRVFTQYAVNCLIDYHPC